jgi:hypothetical protein
MEGKIRVAVVFGGQSGEHEVSLMSSTSIINALDKHKYEIIMIGITREGYWKYYNGPVDNVITGEWEKSAIPLGESRYNLMRLGTAHPSDNIDVVFPVLHGPMGEDGTIQGLFELSGLAYVGSGVLSSALGMDKVYAKLLFERAGLKQAKYRVFSRALVKSDINAIIETAEQQLGYPMFVKPANLGSSVGVSKAKASSISRSSNLSYGRPVASHSLGYMLSLVNPGMVFISLIYTSSVCPCTKKSTRANPLPSMAKKALTAISLTFSAALGDMVAGIISPLLLSSKYLA